MDKHNIEITMDNAAYEKWFRVQVQAAIDDPASGITKEDAKQQFAAKRAILQQRIERVGCVITHHL